MVAIACGVSFEQIKNNLMPECPTQTPILVRPVVWEYSRNRKSLLKMKAMFDVLSSLFFTKPYTYKVTFFTQNQRNMLKMPGTVAGNVYKCLKLVQICIRSIF